MRNLSTTFNELTVQTRAAPAFGDDSPIEVGESPTGLLALLAKMGLAGKRDRPQVTEISSGASAKIYRVDLTWGTVCVKSSMSESKIGLGAKAHLERNAHEREWLKLARATVGEAVPEVLGEQPGSFAMEYLDLRRFVAWRSQLRDGEINPSTAAEVGRLTGRIHAATANNFAVAQRFAADGLFHATRIEPLLLATAQAHPGLAERLRLLAAATAHNKLALVHGDMTPHNILIGPKGPVIIDAEYACYGDPAFDVALCLSHLLASCVLRPQWRDYYLTGYDAFCAAYTQRINWEPSEQLEERAALLLPALALARVHGSGQDDYLQTEREKERIGAISCHLLLDPVIRLAAVWESWRRALAP